jgi:hypothetical protein
MKKIYFLNLLFSVIGFSYSHAQCMMVEAPLSDKVQSATTIFEGKVLSKSSFWNDQHTNIYTSNVVEVYKIFKGTLSSSQVEVMTLGGLVGTSLERVDPELQLQEGETGVFLMQHSDAINPASSTSPDLKFESHYGPQGFVKYDLVDQTASDVFHKYTDIANEVYTPIINQVGQNYQVIKAFDISKTGYRKGVGVLAPSITSFSPTTITAGTKSTLTITGTNFGTNTGSAAVAFANADNGGTSYCTAAPAIDIISWTATQIQLYVPGSYGLNSIPGTGLIRVTDNTGAAAASTTSLTVTYGELTVLDNSNIEYQIRLANQNTSGGYTFKLCNTFNANTAAVAAFKRAIQTWRCNSYVNFQVSPTAIADVCAVKDGNSIVNFDGNCLLGGNLLGRTTTWYDACGSGSPNWQWTLTEQDVIIEANAYPWNYGPAATTGGKYDFESTVLHELGHAQLLAHCINPPKLMHWSRSTNVDVRTPDAAVDIAATNDITARSATAGSCGPTAHIKLTSGNCTLTGILENELAENNIFIYPNPFLTNFTLKISPAITLKEATVKIYDLCGKEVKTISITGNETSIDRGELQDGVYLYSIINNNEKIANGKLVVQ